MSHFSDEHFYPLPCDHCGERIYEPDDGMVLWLVGQDGEGVRQGYDLQIVHCLHASPRAAKLGCFPTEERMRAERATLYEYQLRELLDPDGLVLLLPLGERFNLPIRDVHRVIMRLFVPGYDRLHKFEEQGRSEGLLKRWLPDGYLLQEDLETLRGAYLRTELIAGLDSDILSP